MFLFRGGDSITMKQSPEKWQAHMQRWGAWMGALANEGKFVGAQPLSKDGKHVIGTKKAVTDGPYVEGKEVIGGYMICKASSFEEAMEISKGCPILEFDTGVVEVREITEMA